MLYPSETPFLTSLYAALDGAGPTLKAPEYKLFEHRSAWRYTSCDVNDGAVAGWSPDGLPGSTVTVDINNVSGVTVDSSLVGRMLEIYNAAETVYKGVAIVLSVTSGTTIVLKAIGNAEDATEAVADLADGDKFYFINSAHGEISEAPDAEHDELEVVWNSTFIERTTVKISHILRDEALRGASKELQRLQKEAAKAHKMKIARGMYFSYRPGGMGGQAHGAGGGMDNTFVNYVTDAASDTVRTTLGIFPAMRRYGRDAGSQQNKFEFVKDDFTYNDWVDMTEKVFQYTPESGLKTMYAGPAAISFFAKLGASGFVTTEGLTEPLLMTESRQSSIGLVYKVIDTPHGPIRLVPDPMLRNTPYASDLLIVDPDHAKMVRFQPDSYHGNIETDNRPLTQKDEIFSNLGAALSLMESHVYVRLTEGP